MDCKMVDDFIQYKMDRGCKPVTVKNYRCYIEWADRIIKEHGLNGDPTTWTEHDLRMIINYMNTLPNTQKTVARVLVCFARYYGNYVECRVLTNNEAPNARWITPEQLREAIDKAPNWTIKIILHLGGNYGLRRGEIVNLKPTDIKKGYMIVHGKGHGKVGKIRKVPLIADTDPVIENYLKWRLCECSRTHTFHDDESPLLFFSCRTGASFVTNPQYISIVLKRYFNSIGIDASTHSLRREFITTAYKSGADLIHIMRVVGHDNPQTTERYILKDFEDEKAVINLRNIYISNKLMT